MIVLPAALKIPQGACASTPDDTLDADTSHMNLFNNSKASDIATPPTNKAKVPTDSEGAWKMNDLCTSAGSIISVVFFSLSLECSWD